MKFDLFTPLVCASLVPVCAAEMFVCTSFEQTLYGRKRVREVSVIVTLLSQADLGCSRSRFLNLFDPERFIHE